MAGPHGVSAGEVGGIIAGVTAVLIAVGHGLKWLINWNDARAESRSAKLQVWHDELTAREARLDAEYERRFTTLERQNAALRGAFHHVAAALIHKDPANPALMQAEQMLSQAFPIDLTLLVAQAGAALDAVKQ